ncbi:putative small nuclear ribonucleoprotein E [Aphelenchoides fujianensis]|nr:putative small nuclear ribonucleoprotein E [Aphelenchoides fujianensis]
MPENCAHSVGGVRGPLAKTRRIAAAWSPHGAAEFPTDRRLRFDEKRPRIAAEMPPKVQKVIVQPINLIFRCLQSRSRVQIWLYENPNQRVEGYIIGFDEYMNLVIDEAEEVHMKVENRKKLGRILLKGDNITLIQSLQ